jgi:hypothetical protein
MSQRRQRERQDEKQRVARLLELGPRTWEGMPLSDRLAAEAEAGRLLTKELRALAGDDPRARGRYVVVCGREPGGRVRIVYSADSVPTVDLVTQYERETGCKAWRLTTFAPGVAEEAPPSAVQRQADGARMEWAAGMGEWVMDPGADDVRWIPHDYDRYPVVRVRVNWQRSAIPSRQPVEFDADLDTGCAFCVFPLEGLCEGLGESVLDRAWYYDRVPHLDSAWDCWLVVPDEFRFEVRGGHGWMPFTPQGSIEFRATVQWDERHALSQVRRDRRAFVGRPVWRGKVRLTLASDGPDWEKSPPNTG